MLMHITMPGACGFFVEKMFIFLPDSTVLFLPYLCYTVAVTIGGGNDCREILPGAITRKLCENMKLHLSSSGGVTPIENIFIDQYMPKANGEFVKLYLYLLRCAGTDRELSLSSIADVFDHTEKDVKRALSYWEKLELLKLQYDSNGGLSDIHFLNGSDPDVRGNGVSFDEPPSGQTSSDEGDLPKPKPKSSLTRDRKKQLKEQQQIKQLIFVAEQYYNTVSQRGAPERTIWRKSLRSGTTRVSQQLPKQRKLQIFTIKITMLFSMLSVSKTVIRFL